MSEVVSNLVNKQSTYNSSSKLLFHKERLERWLKFGDQYPIMVDMDLTNACNHRCPHCVGSRNTINDKIPILDKNKSIDKTTMPVQFAKRIISEISELGVKSVIFGGGGDPTMHPYLAELISYVRSKGLEVAVNTNGTLLRDNVLEAIVNNCTWVRVSLDADGPEIYKETHGISREGWDRMINNISRLVARKNSLEKDMTIGLTYLITPNTIKGIYGASSLAKKLGVDYIRFRPLFNWGETKPLSEEDSLILREQINLSKQLSCDGFEVSFPEDRILCLDGLGHTRKYRRCLVHNFITSISASGVLAPCCLLKNNLAFSNCGNLNKSSFKEVWESDERKKRYSNINLDYCPNPCMQEANNELLWNLQESYFKYKFEIVPPKVEPKHLNFL